MKLDKPNAKAVVTPGVKETKYEESENKKLEPWAATIFRQLTARASYLAQDRSDIGFAVKELTRYRSDPGIKDFELLK